MNILAGAILGLLSIMYGAFAEHTMQDRITEEQLESLQTAIRFNQIYAVLIVVIGVFAFSNNDILKARFTRLTGLTFFIGTILFSGSIYLSVLFDISSLTNITPFGGVILIIAWIMLLWIGISVTRNIQNEKR